MKHAALLAETSGIRDAKKRTADEPLSPFIGFDEKGGDEISIDHEDETNPLDLPLTFPKDWDGFVEDQRTSPQPPPYDYVGCLSIISTPTLKDGSLRDEGQMKELLSNLLSDPSVDYRRMLGTPSASSSISSSSSTAHRSPPSPNNPPLFPARRSTVSSTTPTIQPPHSSTRLTLPPPQSSRPMGPPSQPNIPLWAGKRSLRTMTFNHDTVKGRTAGTVVTRSLSASEAE